jgi:predicted ArsR family transcriptional regulator
MGHRPKGSSLERIDNDAGYSPENCIWADAKAQQNNKRTNYRVTVGSTTLTVQQWAEKMQISPYTLHSRLVKLKWSPERAVSAAVTPQPWRRREGEGRTNTRT